MTEKEKYEGIYGSRSIYPNYGRTNHGKGAIKIIKEWLPKSLIDVGCGHNEFVKEIRSLNISSIGLDFACSGADIIADAKNIPFENKKFDVLTAFDMLEHLLQEDVPIVLKEFERVSSRFVFSICCKPSINKWKGHTLHPTVMPENWWIEQIIKAGGNKIEKYNQYILGYWIK